MIGGSLNTLALGGPPSDPTQYQQWLQVQSQRFGVSPSVVHQAVQQSQSTDAPWVQNLKRLVQPNTDPGAVVQPQYQNTDPGLNRLGPQVGSVLGT